MKFSKRFIRRIFLFILAAGFGFSFHAFSSPKQVTVKMTAALVQKKVVNGKVTFIGGWSPKRVIVDEGDYVTLIITSVDAQHELVLPAFNVDTVIPADQTVTVSFTASKSGIFPFTCGENGCFGTNMHKFMVGELVVNEPSKN